MECLKDWNQIGGCELSLLSGLDSKMMSKWITISGHSHELET